MRLSWLAVEAFRNLDDGRVELASGTTVLLGDNGQGKTSLLEAIGVLATTKSFRGARPAEMARHGSRSFRVAGLVRSESGDVELEAASEDGRRRTLVGRQDTDLAAYIGHLTVVPITQVHAGIIRGSPQERRDFLDRGILGLRTGYLRTLARYRRTVKQKNALLRAGAAGRDEELRAWNERLAEDGADITRQRRAYVAELADRLATTGRGFLPAGEQLGLELDDVLGKAPQEPADVQALLLARFERAIGREIAQGRSVTGPHHDDLVISLGGRDIRRYASSGQQRHALLALKLAKVETFRLRRAETPLLLVDDVDTEIDRARLERFLERVGGSAQAVLTSSKRDLFGRVPADSLFLSVEGGRIRPG